MKRDIFILSITNFITHFMMLFVEGAWFDDCKYYVIEYSDLKEHYQMAGRHIAYYLIGLVEWMPSVVYHLLVMIFFTLSSILVYLILSELRLNKTESLSIAVLFCVIPANDARVMLCVFPYTASLFIFLLAMLLLIKWINVIHKNLWKRGLILCLFFVSFSMNSMLVLYVLPILFVISSDYTQNNEYSVNMFIRRIDIFFLPICYWGIKKLFFSPSGHYVDYNSVTLTKCINAFKIMPQAIVDTTYGLIKNWIHIIEFCPWVIFIVLVMSFVMYMRYRKEEVDMITLKQKVIRLGIAALSYILTIIPYVVAKGRGVASAGLTGRDGILLPISVALSIFFLMQSFGMPKWIIKTCLFTFIILGTIHFNTWYVAYVRDYYEQLAVQKCWLETDDIRENNTFISIYESDNEYSVWGGGPYYLLTALASRTYCDTTRFFAAGVGDLSVLGELKEGIRWNIEDVSYAMSEYDYTDLAIDGIIYTRHNMSLLDAIVMRVYRIVDAEKFDKNIDDYVEYRYMNLTAECSKKILDKYEAGDIKNDEDLLEYLYGCNYR